MTVGISHPARMEKAKINDKDAEKAKQVLFETLEAEAREEDGED